jgi:uncharacterized protein (TIGR02001 family)
MKKTLLAAALASSLTSFGAVAADKAPEPDFSISGNFGLFSDYRFRGISQTDRESAAQGGFDFTHKSGFYAGNWNSNISSSFIAGSNLEQDFYAGFSKEVGPIGINLGVLRYSYPGATATTKPDTTELYVGASWGPISYKFSRSSTNYFGITNSKGSTYNEVNFSQSISEKVTLSAHIGTTDVANQSTGDFSDARVGVAYDLGGYSLGVTYYSNSGLSAAEKVDALFLNNGNKLYESAAVVSISKTF